MPIKKLTSTVVKEVASDSIKSGLFDGLEDPDPLYTRIEMETARDNLVVDFLDGPVDAQPGAKEAVRQAPPAGPGGSGSPTPPGERPEPNRGPTKVEDPAAPQYSIPVVPSQPVSDPPEFVVDDEVAENPQINVGDIDFDDDDDDDNVGSLESMIYCFLSLVPSPSDEQVHALAFALGKSKEELEEVIYQMLHEAMHEEESSGIVDPQSDDELLMNDGEPDEEIEVLDEQIEFDGAPENLPGIN